MEAITLEEALSLFKLPRELGEYDGKTVVIGAGRYGPYVQHKGMYTSLPKECDPMTVTLEEAVNLIKEKQQEEAQKHLKIFAEDEKLEVMNGRYGPYLVYDGKNYRLPKSMHARASKLKYEECMEIINKEVRGKS